MTLPIKNSVHPCYDNNTNNTYNGYGTFQTLKVTHRQTTRQTNNCLFPFRQDRCVSIKHSQPVQPSVPWCRTYDFSSSDRKSTSPSAFSILWYASKPWVSRESTASRTLSLWLRSGWALQPTVSRKEKEAMRRSLTRRLIFPWGLYVLWYTMVMLPFSMEAGTVESDPSRWSSSVQAAAGWGQSPGQDFRFLKLKAGTFGFAACRELKTTGDTPLPPGAMICSELVETVGRKSRAVTCLTWPLRMWQVGMYKVRLMVSPRTCLVLKVYQPRSKMVEIFLMI